MNPPPLVSTDKARQQFILREYPNGGEEYIDTIWCMRKIVYNTGDVVYLKEDKVIAVKPHDHNGRVLKYTEDNLTMLDSLSLPKLTRQARLSFQKQVDLKVF